MYNNTQVFLCLCTHVNREGTFKDVQGCLNIGHQMSKPQELGSEISGSSAVSKGAGVSNLLASLGHTGRRVVLGHTLNMLQYVSKKKRISNVLNKFTILCGTHS